MGRPRRFNDEEFLEDDFLDDSEEAEGEAQKSLDDDEYISAVFLRDKCDAVDNLLYCLEALFNDSDIRRIKTNPPSYLFEHIRNMVREIESGLRKL